MGEFSYKQVPYKGSIANEAEAFLASLSADAQASEIEEQADREFRLPSERIVIDRFSEQGVVLDVLPGDNFQTYSQDVAQLQILDIARNISRAIQEDHPDLENAHEIVREQEQVIRDRRATEAIITASISGDIPPTDRPKLLAAIEASLGSERFSQLMKKIDDEGLVVAAMDRESVREQDSDRISEAKQAIEEMIEEYLGTSVKNHDDWDQFITLVAINAVAVDKGMSLQGSLAEKMAEADKLAERIGIDTETLARVYEELGIVEGHLD